MNRLKSLKNELRQQSKYMLGYPLNMNPVCHKELSKLLGFVVNNLGDPFSGGNYQLNSFRFERDVVRYFCRLFHLAPEGAWGYVTNCGSEGNLRGLSLGKAKYPDGVIYYSDKTHYSVANAAKLMGADTVVIGTTESHKIDLVDFKAKFVTRKPAIVALTAGTTMAGAIDDIDGVVGLVRGRPNYIHVDAALSGLLLPFLGGSPPFDFRTDICSISVSGHKMLGCPMPCGVFICRKQCMRSERIDYINSHNSTIFGSRDGLSAVALWATLKHYGKRGLARMAKDCVSEANHLAERLARSQWPSWKNDFGNVVMLAEPSKSITKRWQLATADGWAHAIVMPHVKRRTIDKFVGELLITSKKGGVGPCRTSSLSSRAA